MDIELPNGAASGGDGPGLPIGEAWPQELVLSLADRPVRGNVPVKIWGAEALRTLNLLQDDSPQRIEVLLALTGRLLEACDEKSTQVNTAHDYLLEALRLLNSQDADPYLRLLLLDRIWQIEWSLARAEQDHPPNSGLYFDLALTHFDMAAVIYRGREQPQTADELEALATIWTSTDRLRAQWDELHIMGPVDPLLKLMFLGMAAFCGQEEFVETFEDDVGQAIAGSFDASMRCEQFTWELDELEQLLDATACREVIAPWREILERMYT